jgi:ribose 5-phosphate isomerase RpiB
MIILICWNEMTAKCARKHGNTNILCLGARTLNIEQAKQIVKI